MKNFGFSGYDNVISIGTNGKMNEFSAAMGLTGLENLQQFIQTNHENYKEYQKNLSGIPGVQLINYSDKESRNYQYIVLEIDEELTHIRRDRIQEILQKENILARKYFYPGCHNMEPYRSTNPYAGKQLPETEKLTKKVLILPTGTSMNENTVKSVGELIRFIVDNALIISKNENRNLQKNQ